MTEINIFTDGGARGNPGPAALGVYIEDEKRNSLARIGKKIGEATNNIAEYSAIVEGLEWALNNIEKHKIAKITFYMDSLLAYSQITGLFKTKNQHLKEMILKIRSLESQINLPIFYNHIPREKNKMADFMVNQALDNRL
ncbi:MAG TPA: ribonuclease HI family protein [Candidatus Sulfotelmatobacter sp.]|nr:ribonuclease HI family protein [Candidatus Sulfotelmatobacter sp.]